ncbi:isoleucine N-monooxygenase 2-like [Momordica charantia]|uniref:Isoleucine N-monooxygenase 2-like n=1 Tax=Momordica charantia TaxID=3673 RepID=A0A6J1D6G9_MOMCH|nr:isoleucine N-monooxygenase 2-like [Momordica charantia]
MEALLFISQLTYQNSPTAITKTFTLFVFMAFISAIFSQCYRKRKHSVLQLPPGPNPWPLVGCLPAMLATKSPKYKWIHAVMKQFDTEIACIRLGNTYVMPVTSPELAVEFLKRHDSVFASRSTISNTVNVLSRGLLTTAFSPLGHQWKKMRRILASEIFCPSTLHQMLGHRTNEADTLLRYIFSLTTTNTVNKDGAVVNVRSVTQHYCGNIIRRMLFNKRYYGKGREDGGPSFEEEEHNQALLTILRHVNAFSISDFMPCLKPFDLDGHEKIMKRALKALWKYDEPIINERVQQWKDGKREGAEDILDILISTKDGNGKSLLTIDEIKAQITELQIATIDNPSNAVEWTMAELLNQPKILQKAIEELDRVVGRERLVQESDIPKLKYLTACARESFRLHPFSPFNIPHVSNADIVVAGYFIPKGSEVILSRSGLGRNPRIWEDPMRFDPERHLKDETVELGLSEPNLRFISFTRGRRGCVGSSLGTNITMMLLGRLLQGFSWSLPFGTTKIEFSEADELSLPKPLHLHAKPRLPHIMYPTS